MRTFTDQYDCYMGLSYSENMQHQWKSFILKNISFEVMNAKKDLPKNVKYSRNGAFRSTAEVFLEKGVWKICNKLLCNFIEITHWHGCSPVRLLHIFETLFYKNTSGGLLLNGYLPSWYLIL